MKVVLCLNHFLPEFNAGTENYVFALAKQLQAISIQVRIIIPNFDNQYTETYNYEGLEIIKYSENSPFSFSNFSKYFKPSGLVEFERILKIEEPDVVHFHEVTYGRGIGVHHFEVAKKLQAQIILTVHLAGFSCPNGSVLFKNLHECNGICIPFRCSVCTVYSKGLRKTSLLVSTFSYVLNSFRWQLSNSKFRLFRVLAAYERIINHINRRDAVVRYSDKIVVISKWYQKVLLGNGIPEKKLAFIPQGFPNPTNTKILRLINRNPDAIRLIFLGRIFPDKGLHILLKALSELNFSNVSLDIYGQIRDLEYARSCKESISESVTVNWFSELNHDEVIKILPGYDALCLCSLVTEMSPLVIKESFMCGVPVIASNVKGNVEQISDMVNGLLYQFNSVMDLKSKLIDFITVNELRVKLRRNVSPPEPFERVALQYLELYANLMKQN